MPKEIKTPEEVKRDGISRVLKVFQNRRRVKELQGQIKYLQRQNAILRQRVEQGRERRRNIL